MNEQPKSLGQNPRGIDRFLNWVERVGNKLPDPALLFVFALLITWVLSWLLAGTEFQLMTATGPQSKSVVNQLTGSALATFLKDMVETFTHFHPLGVVLVALLGVGVAERSGFINAGLKLVLQVTPAALLTPILTLVAIVSHTAADAGYVLVIPLGGVIFYAAGRHPLAGIVAAFAGVSGGFSANFIPSGIDPLLAGLTQAGTDVLDKAHVVNPLCNWGFTAASSALIIGVVWVLTDFVIEPRLRRGTAVDGDRSGMPNMDPIGASERRGFTAGMIALVLGIGVLTAVAVSESSPLRAPTTDVITMQDGTVYRGKIKDMPAEVTGVAAAPQNPSASHLVLVRGADGATAFSQAFGKILVRPGITGGESRDDLVFYEDQAAKAPALLPKAQIKSTVVEPGSLSSFTAPLMGSIVPLIFLLFLIPGIVHGYVSGTFKTHRDVIKGMSVSMETMGYYLVMAFFASLFIYSFNRSQLGSLLAVTGADFIRSAGLGAGPTIIGVIILCSIVNLVVGSASAKWALLAPIVVPMLMSLGYSPEFTQAAYRVGDSSTNIITPLMPYFPLVVAFCQRYVKGTGIGTLTSLMLPYSMAFLVLWTAFLLLWWGLDIPLGFDGGFVYPRAK